MKKLDKPKIKKRKNKISNRDTIYNEDTLMKEHIVEYTNYPNNVLEFKKESKTVHPTQKPVDLLEYLINTYTVEGHVVLDSCMGSGSVGVACATTNRRFIGIELDNTYFELAKNRIEKSYMK